MHSFILTLKSSSIKAKFSKPKRRIVLISIVLVVLVVYNVSIQDLLPNNIILPASGERRKFAVFGCATPTKGSHRGYDYAFYMPLTVLAWKRVGYECIIQIIGREEEWTVNPALSYVLETLKRVNTHVMFLDAKVHNRMMISQTARIFISKMKEYPGQDDDFIITSDADIWPIKKQHYEVTDKYKLFLRHPSCCATFRHANLSISEEKIWYQMIPMFDTGARASTWREIIDSNYSIIKNAEDILNIFHGFFGDKVYEEVIFDRREWFYDQMYLSLQIKKWSDRGANRNLTLVQNEGARLHRVSWNIENYGENNIDSLNDAHLILDGFLPDNWSTKVLPLVHLIYKNESRETSDWCEDYAKKFYDKYLLVTSDAQRNGINSKV